MTPEDLARRRPVWDAMSDLFLDTEVRWQVPWVARRCAESGYDDATLERIFWIEVFPEAIGNMLQPAGEWIALALDEAALIRRAQAGRMPRLRRRLHGGMVAREWHAVCEVTRWLRPLDEPLRTRFAEALRLCGKPYFDTPGEPPHKVEPAWVDAVRDLLPDAWQRYEPVCRAMLLDDEAPTHGARAAAVRLLMAG